jgi:hypothetical protein
MKHKIKEKKKIKNKKVTTSHWIINWKAPAIPQKAQGMQEWLTLSEVGWRLKNMKHGGVKKTLNFKGEKWNRTEGTTTAQEVWAIC